MKGYKSAQEILDDLGQEKVLELLNDDHNYYDGIGKLFLSNSNMKTLIKDPEQYGAPQGDPTPPLKIGNAFHKAVLEPEKFEAEIVVDASTRNTKIYKEALEESGEKMLLLRKDHDNILKWRQRMLANQNVQDLIVGDNIDYEVPYVGEIMGEWFKGKADIVNHTEKLIVDIKTSAEIERFRTSAYKYGYDSQAFIYQQLTGYEMVFLVIDKTTLKMGLYDCSENFLVTGKDKVIDGVTAFRMFYKDNPDFDWTEWLITETL